MEKTNYIKNVITNRIDTINKEKQLNVLKTYIIQFIYPNGNGWAFINARNVSEASSVFYRQTRFQNTTITSLKETRWYGENIQLVFEGSVTTAALVNTTVSLSDLIDATDAFDSVESYLRHLFDLSDYYTKEEVNEMFNSHILPNLDLNTIVEAVLRQLDLSIYVTDKELDTTVRTAVSAAIRNLDLPPGPQGPQGEPGPAGVGVSNILYANNYLNFVLTNGDTIPVYMPNGGGGGDNPEVIETYQFGQGNFNAAWNKAQANPSVHFQWILDDVDDDGNAFSKIIWHKGNGEFIDTLGASILGHIDGITIVCKYPCILRTKKTSSSQVKDVTLQAGVNNFSFATLKQQGVITSEITPSLYYINFFKQESGATVKCRDSVVSIDFGGLTLTSVNLGETPGSAGNDAGILLNQSELQYIDRLKFNVTNSTDTNLVVGTICSNCSKLRYANISGNITVNYYASNKRLVLFDTCPNLKKLSLGGLVVNAPNLDLCFRAGYSPYARKGSLVELDIRGFNCDVNKMSEFLNNQSKLRKLTIGNFNTGSVTGSTGFADVTNCTLICTSLTPPTIPTNGSTGDWLNKKTFDAIYVPDEALSAYRTAWSGSDCADIIYSINDYIDVYNE